MLLSPWQYIALMFIALFIIIVWTTPTDDHQGNLTDEEYQEYEFLGESMDWRVLDSPEIDRFAELERKRIGGQP